MREGYERLFAEIYKRAVAEVEAHVRAKGWI